MRASFSPICERDRPPCQASFQQLELSMVVHHSGDHNRLSELMSSSNGYGNQAIVRDAETLVLHVVCILIACLEVN